ncbi:hypothetical protein AAFF_G00336490 [Aldrovandia affinis]|uniref:Uncharacterized protein n=1 Tax=Aldrovandia affinis TaxID=143900 RepID=A0AAD7R8K5_9TELE|nr:hypothetical protein AAFF_G00336490 [Aldrovandia affinis]
MSLCLCSREPLCLCVQQIGSETVTHWVTWQIIQRRPFPEAWSLHVLLSAPCTMGAPLHKPRLGQIYAASSSLVAEEMLCQRARPGTVSSSCVTSLDQSEQAQSAEALEREEKLWTLGPRRPCGHQTDPPSSDSHAISDHRSRRNLPLLPSFLTPSGTRRCRRV